MAVHGARPEERSFLLYSSLLGWPLLYFGRPAAGWSRLILPLEFTEFGSREGLEIYFRGVQSATRPQRKNAMKRIWTILGVSDVPGSFKWYQSLFGQPETPPAHDHFGQILDTDGTVLLCLHQWGAHEHPSLMSPDEAPPGNGLLLFFRVDDFDMALKRARALVTRLEEEPHVNPNTQTEEFSLRDPDGYYVTISALSAPPPARRRRSSRE
jgi:predicted enzyme related to lactoylglutathione lyase